MANLKQRFTSYKPMLVLLAALGLWWAAPPFFRRSSESLFYELHAPFWSSAAYLNDLQEFWALRGRGHVELIEAGRDLARLNAAYQLRIQQTEWLEEEVHRLEALLDLPPLPAYRYEVARVIHRDLNSWWQRLVVRKGSRHGIIEGAAVVYAGGVVGRVTDVHLYTSEVELVSSRQFRVAARVESDSRPITYQGGDNTAFATPRGRVFNVPPDIVATPSVPRRLVSSRLGGAFPDGLTIGMIEELRQSPDGLFQGGRVRLDPELHELREVTILIPIQPREAATEAASVDRP